MKIGSQRLRLVGNRVRGQAWLFREQHRGVTYRFCGRFNRFNGRWKTSARGPHGVEECVGFRFSSSEKWIGLPPPTPLPAPPS
uniref:Uncharacterized protein n=1 Tax=Vespula pensylvanica TaxID=30213 RepID=A0A834K6I2_VESPE|nr:hypothetical protein H0235_016214 [Vespula pensylvanica]